MYKFITFIFAASLLLPQNTTAKTYTIPKYEITLPGNKYVKFPEIGVCVLYGNHNDYSI